MCQSFILIGKGSRVTSLGHSYNSACNRQRKKAARRWWQSSSLPPSPSHVLWLSGPRGKWSPERADGAEAAVADHCAALDLFISLVDSRRICSAEWPSFLCISALNSPRKTRIGTGKKVKRVERKGLARAEPSRADSLEAATAQVGNSDRGKSPSSGKEGASNNARPAQQSSSHFLVPPLPSHATTRCATAMPPAPFLRRAMISKDFHFSGIKASFIRRACELRG